MTISQISLAFKNCKKEKKPALITFTVAGDNTKKNSLKILNSIAKYVDILEQLVSKSNIAKSGSGKHKRVVKKKKTRSSPKKLPKKIKSKKKSKPKPKRKKKLRTRR